MTDQPQDIDALKARYDELRDRKTAAAANLTNANKRLDELKAQARQAYGTDSLEELIAKLTAMKTENERKRDEYQKALDKIDGDLKKVEADYQTSLQQGEGEQ